MFLPLSVLLLGIPCIKFFAFSTYRHHHLLLGPNLGRHLTSLAPRLPHLVSLQMHLVISSSWYLFLVLPPEGSLLSLLDSPLVSASNSPFSPSLQYWSNTTVLAYLYSKPAISYKAKFTLLAQHPRPCQIWLQPLQQPLLPIQTHDSRQSGNEGYCLQAFAHSVNSTPATWRDALSFSKPEPSDPGQVLPSL